MKAINTMTLTFDSLEANESFARSATAGFFTQLDPTVEELCDIFENDPMMRERTVGIGVLPKEDALRLGVVGPVARGSGIATDVRKEAPYAA